MAWNDFDQVTSILRRDRMPEVQDGVYDGNPVTAFLNANSKRETRGGSEIFVPVLTGSTDLGGSIVIDEDLDNPGGRGVGDFDLVQAARFFYGLYHHRIRIYGAHEAIFQNDDLAVVDFIESQFMQAENDLQDAFSTDVLADHTATGPSQFLGTGAGAFSSGGGPVDSLGRGLHNIDPTGAPTAYGDLDRDSIGASWDAQVFDAGSAAFNTDDLRRNLILPATLNRRTFPTLLIVEQGVYADYLSFAEDSNRGLEPNATLVELGFDQTRVMTEFDGVTILQDTHMPAGNAYLVNLDALEMRVMRGLDFMLTPFLRDTNYWRKNADILWMGNVIVKNPPVCGRIINGLSSGNFI